jgi:hypothetical protein
MATATKRTDKNHGPGVAFRWSPDGGILTSGPTVCPQQAVGTIEGGPSTLSPEIVHRRSSVVRWTHGTPVSARVEESDRSGNL